MYVVTWCKVTVQGKINVDVYLCDCVAFLRKKNSFQVCRGLGEGGFCGSHIWDASYGSSCLIPGSKVEAPNLESWKKYSNVNQLTGLITILKAWQIKPLAHPLTSSHTTPNRIYDFTELLFNQRKNLYTRTKRTFLFHLNDDSGRLTNPTAHAGSRGKKPVLRVGQRHHGGGTRFHHLTEANDN